MPRTWCRPDNRMEANKETKKQCLALGWLLRRDPSQLSYTVSSCFKAKKLFGILRHLTSKEAVRDEVTSDSGW